MTANSREAPSGAVSPNAPDELAMAIQDLVQAFAPDQGETAHPLFRKLVRLQGLILSRLASQEETIRADGEALKPFAVLADMPCKLNGEPYEPGDNEVVPAGGIIWADLRAARSRLKARTA